MHTPHPTSRSLSQKVNLNHRRSHLSKKLLRISCSLALLNGCFVGLTSLAQAQRSNNIALPLRTKTAPADTFNPAELKGVTCNEPLKGNVVHGIRRAQAIAIASKHARTRYQSIERFKIIPCELTTFWRVIFDRGGPEYVISKHSGFIYRVQLIPENWSPASSASKKITEEKAVEIAARDAAIPGVDLSTYSLFTVELEKVWRVFVEPKLHYWPGTRRLAIPHSSAPNYVIDKSTGSILRKQRYGSPDIDVSSRVGSNPVRFVEDDTNYQGVAGANTRVSLVSTPADVELRPPTPTKVLTLKGITAEAAISIAKKEARRRHFTIRDLKIVPCEQVEVWRIIFDGGGPEFVIDKETGMVIRAQKIPQSAKGNHAAAAAEITRQQAIDIAKRDIPRSYAVYRMDPEYFSVFACEQRKAWRVIFDFKLDRLPASKFELLPNAKFPKYVIDKASGNVIYRELN